MSAFSISAIDKLIQPCKKPASMEDPNEKRPSFSFYPPLYMTPPIEPQTPITPICPSPYVVNFKRRGPVKRANAPGEVALHCHAPSEIDQSAVDEDTVISQEDARSLHMLERNHSLEFGVSGFGENADIAGRAFETRIEPHHTEDGSERPILQSEADYASDKRIALSDNTRLEIPCNDGTHFATGSDNSYFMSPRAFTSAEEFFDAPEAPLDDCANEDEVNSSSLTPRMRGKSAEIATPRVQLEIARRIKAEEAVASLQRRWNEMARKCSLIGIPLTSGEDTSESRGQSVQDLYEQFSEKLVVARLVGGAVASAAVRAAKDEELESMVARKNIEISRLWDKLQYIELVNREMSQRNQEAIEAAQRRKRRHRRRQKWAFGCFCSALCLGSAGLLCYKFLPWDKMEACTPSLKGSTKIEHVQGESRPDH